MGAAKPGVGRIGTCPGHAMNSSMPATKEIEKMTQLRQLSGRDRGFVRGRWFSLQAALAGAAHTLRTQPNAWIELVACFVIAAAGWWLQIAAIEWALLAFVALIILALESVNTAVEAVVDLVSPDYHPLAKVAKDAAAGALIFGVLASLCVAAVIFLPRIWALF